MALGPLKSLTFRLKRLAGVIWPIAENLNNPNQRRGPDDRAFPLPSRLRPGRTRKTAMGGAIRIDFIVFSGKVAARPFWWHRPNPLTDRSKPTEGRRCFYLAVQITTRSLGAKSPDV